MNPNIEILVSGDKADIFVYKDDNGNKPVLLFIDQLQKNDQSKIFPLLNLFAEKGEIRNDEKFKLEEKPIFAFKSYQVRLFCFFLPKASKKSLVLTHGYIKKKNKVPKKELDKAKNIYHKVISNK